MECYGTKSFYYCFVCSHFSISCFFSLYRTHISVFLVIFDNWFIRLLAIYLYSYLFISSFRVLGCLNKRMNELTNKSKTLKCYESLESKEKTTKGCIETSNFLALSNNEKMLEKVQTFVFPSLILLLEIVSSVSCHSGCPLKPRHTILLSVLFCVEVMFIICSRYLSHSVNAWIVSVKKHEVHTRNFSL